MASKAAPLLDATAANLRQLDRLKWENRLLKTLSVALFVAGGLLGTFLPGTALRLQKTHSNDGSSSEGYADAFLVGARPALRQSAPHPAAKLLNSALPSSNLAEVDANVEIPEFFDTRQQWLGCGTFVIDQGQCGDCWAASASNVMGDRVCIHLLEGGKPVPLPHSGAHGAGSLERMFQQAGKCVGVGTMGMAHEHGCRRGAFFVSPQPLVSCGNMNNTDPPTYHPYPEHGGYKPGHTLYPSSGGCNGGESQDAWRFFYHEGLTIMDSTQQGGCTPYTSGLCSAKDPNNNGCHTCDFSQCDDTGLKPQVFTVDSFGWIMEEDLPDRGSWNAQESFDQNGTDKPRPADQKLAMDRQVRKMQIEMMTNGPLHTCIDDYANFGVFFNEHPQGIYNSTEGSPLVGGHCIELVGWGTDHATGMPYWTWKNSWGTNFANGGFARFIRGVDLLGIESDVWTGCPSGSNCRLTAGVVHNETWVPNHAWFPVGPLGPILTTTTVLPTSTTAPPPRHPTSAKEPSRRWPGGKEVELSRERFSHGLVAPLVVAAVRQALGRPELEGPAALAMARRVWTHSVRGLRVRVEAEGASEHAIAIRHMEGHMTVA